VVGEASVRGGAWPGAAWGRDHRCGGTPRRSRLDVGGVVQHGPASSRRHRIASPRCRRQHRVPGPLEVAVAMRIGFVPNSLRNEASALTADLAGWLEAEGHTVCVPGYE